LGELINSAVCWGQLLKVKPTTGEYYLQRGLIYERIGYFAEAKQDFVAFATYCPEAHDVLRDKILSEKNQARRQQLLSVLSKLS
jgi:regulator of sirC expression with transglutaminase-like and TPR domain